RLGQHPVRDDRRSARHARLRAVDPGEQGLEGAADEARGPRPSTTLASDGASPPIIETVTLGRSARSGRSGRSGGSGRSGRAEGKGKRADRRSASLQASEIEAYRDHDGTKTRRRTKIFLVKRVLREPSSFRVFVVTAATGDSDANGDASINSS